MQKIAEDSKEARRIDDALGSWRQGDFAFDTPAFLHLADPSTPLTDAASGSTARGLQALRSEVRGLTS